MRAALHLWGFVFLCGGVVHSGEKGRWTRDLDMGQGCRIRWSHEDPEYLVMEISAPVKGYVAVGFSPNGAMAGSDMVMGWVDSGTGEAHIKDLYAMGNTAPVEDVQSDYELLWGEESEAGTTIRFRRKWDTCDAKRDFKITDDTVRLIWAVSPNDPVTSDGIFQPNYHQVDFRGVRSVFLKFPTFSAGFPDEAPVPNPSVHSWDARFDNVLVDGLTDTSYHCKIFKAPEFPDKSKKHQIIGFRTLIDPPNKQWVHHINFFECSVPPHAGNSIDIFEQHLNQHGETCYTRNMPPEWSHYCITVPFVWAAGSEGIMLPEHGGFPLHEEHGGATYFMMEMHYDNPLQLRFNDSSGVRIFVTEETRPNDYGTIDIHVRFGQFQMIPPKASFGYRNMAFCSSECTQNVIPPEGITVTHSILHGHLTARKLVLKHLRNGQELPPIAEDLHYDFNYQHSRIVNPPRKVLPGDIVMVECEYDTSDRDNITYGGISTRDEMCQGYLTYYPKIPLAVCKTQPEFHNFFDALGIHKVEGQRILELLQLPYKPKPNQLYDPGDDAYIEKNGTSGKPEHTFDVLYVGDPRTPGRELQTVRTYVNSLDWVKDNGALIERVWKQWWEGEYVTFCTAPGFKRIPLEDYTVKYPEFAPYQKPLSKGCLLQASSASVIIQSIILYLSSVACTFFVYNLARM